MWTFQDSGRAVSYLIMGRSFESACIYQFDPNCACLSCTWEVLVGGPPINLKALNEALDNHVPGLSCQTPPWAGRSQIRMILTDFALSQVKPRPQPLPGSLLVAAAVFPLVSEVAQALPPGACAATW